MHDAIRNQDIRDDDAGGVYVDGSVLDGDGYRSTADGHECAVGKRGRVANGAVYDVVFEDLGELSGGEGADCGTDGLECRI